MNQKSLLKLNSVAEKVKILRIIPPKKLLSTTLTSFNKDFYNRLYKNKKNIFNFTRVIKIFFVRKISQKDIATTLNVSRVTVTKALKNHPDIAVKTRELIKAKAMEMGYIPDFIGRSLVSKRTHTIGIVLPKIAHSFFAYSVEKFYEAAKNRNYHIIPMISFEKQDIELVNIQTLLSMRVDGIIIDIASNSTDNANFKIAKKSGCKILFYDRYPLNSLEQAVVTNDRECARDLTRLLIEKGYRKICHFAGPPYLNISVERQMGYEEAMSEKQLLKYILNVDLQVRDGYEATKLLAKRKELPEAIFAVNDSVAHGIYEAADELGLKIPDDMAIAGFGDIELSKHLNPPLTTIRIPIKEMTEAAINLLIDMIENNTDQKERIVFPSTIIVRKST